MRIIPCRKATDYPKVRSIEEEAEEAFPGSTVIKPFGTLDEIVVYRPKNQLQSDTADPSS